MKGLVVILWYALWGMYYGATGKKTVGEIFTLSAFALLALLTEISLPFVFTILLFFLYIAVRKAREGREI